MTGERPSGLRNPAGAVRGMGAGALAIEALVLLMAIVPLVKLGAGTGALAATALAVLCAVLAGLLRYPWAWYAGIALQVVLLVCGLLLHAALAVLGLVFGAVWAYALYVRRIVLGRRRT